MQRGGVFRTKLCDLLGIEYPVILAGMGAMQGDPLLSACRAELVATVSNAGGLGIIGGARFTPEELRAEIRKTRELTSKPFGVDLILPAMATAAGSATESKAQLPGEYVAFMSRLREELGIPEAEVERPVLTWEQIWQQVEVILEEGVPVFASGLGNPEKVVPKAHAQATKVIAVAGNVRNARRLAEAGVDIIVAQGYEGGGHTGRIGTLALVPQVIDAVSPVPVVAAGGIGDGRGLVASLALGAVGVWCGTVFLATHEACIHQFHKEKIIRSTEEDTKITRFYTGKTARLINNKFIDSWEQSGLSALPYPLQGLLVSDIQESLRRAAHTDYLSGYAGQIAGMIKELKSARQVVEGMIEEAAAILTRTLPQEVILDGR